MGISESGWADFAEPDWERQASCHFGDHNYSGATCQDCGYFNSPLLNWLKVEKAEYEGRHHGNHYHLTIDAAEKCKNSTHDQQICADNGGCLYHDASNKYLNLMRANNDA